MQINIREVAKQKKGWSIYELVKRLGLPQQTVYSWVNGRTQPTWPNIDKLCLCLDCSIGELFTDENTLKKQEMEANASLTKLDNGGLKCTLQA